MTLQEFLRVAESTDQGLMWTAVAALAASLSALFAALYVWLTYRLVKMQTEPHVVVYVKHDESRPTILLIVVENVGRGLARNVTFESSRPIPAEAFGIEETKARTASVMTDGPLIDGIPTLGPGDTRKITWGQFGGLKKALEGDPLDITCRFKRSRWKVRKAKTKSRLEVKSFEGTDASSTETQQLIKEVSQLGKHLQAIARTLENRLRRRSKRKFLGQTSWWSRLLRHLGAFLKS